MKNKLRFKFVIAAMTAVTTVLSLIVGGMIAVSYCNIVRSADNYIDIIIENGGILPIEKTKLPRDKSPDFLFETRYFTVFIDSSGASVGIYSDNMSLLNTSEAEQLASDIYNSDHLKGFYFDYRFRRIETQNGTTIVFLSCFKSLSEFRSFAASGLFFSSIGIVFVFLLVILLSGVVVRPIAESYSKQRRFITDASHDIKTPIAIINANVDVIEAENGESEWTKSIKKQVSNLTELTQHLITLSMMEDNKDPVMNDVNLSEIVSEGISPFYTLASACDKSFTSNIESNIVIQGNKAMLQQLVSILADNAVKYSSEHGDIFVSLKKNGKTAILSIENSVDEMAPGNHEKLFDRFYRDDTSRNSETGGHGIGLSIAKAVTEAHKARISAVSPNGKILNISTTFRL